VVIEKLYGKLQASFSLQRTSVTIKSYSGEEKEWSLRLLKEHLQQHSPEERERWQNLKTDTGRMVQVQVPEPVMVQVEWQPP